MSSEAPNERAETIKDLMEIVVAVPANTALLKVAGLTMDEEGNVKEFKGEFNLEQILMSRAKFIQMEGGDGEDDTPVGRIPVGEGEASGDEPDGDEPGSDAGADEGEPGTSEEGQGETEETQEGA